MDDLTDYNSLSLAGVVLAADLVHAAAHGRHLDEAGLMRAWNAGRSHRIDVGFYKSHAMELKRR